MQIGFIGLGMMGAGMASNLQKAGHQLIVHDLSRQAALRDAATVSALFNMIVRLADSFGWDVPTWDRLTARAPAMLEGGYIISAIGSR